MENYQDFLASKRVAAVPSGFDWTCDNAWPKPFQVDIVRWACKLGRAAIFAGCGLGKTLMQLLWADAVGRKTNGRVLVLSPLAVGPQTQREAAKFGIPGVQFCRDESEVEPATNIVVTNYQRLLGGHFHPDRFDGVVLDESSILKSYMGKTKQLLCEAFANTLYRLCCTATPAPNDHMELGNHSQFLGVMDSDEMLSRWFINDQAKTGSYRLKGHAEKDYWRWVASWAVCIERPSDLGYSDDSYELPPLNFHQHIVGVDITADAGDSLFRSERLTATTLHQEMRMTADSRAREVAEIVRGGGDPWIIWCNTNYEADAIREHLGAVVEVRGDDSDDKKEQRLNQFSQGMLPRLLTKPSVAGFGMNWQHCHNVAFVGLSYSQEQFYQAVRRTWRFGQTKPVECHIVIADSEGEVLGAIQRKERQAEEMKKNMLEASREAHLEASLARKLIAAPQGRAEGKLWTIHMGDCVLSINAVEDNSVGFTIFSPPFAGLYIYSEAEADMGNSVDDAEFFRHFGYLVPELLRVTIPGRLCAVHCKDLPKYMGRDGAAGLRDFPGEVVRLFESHGWTFHSRVTVWKCPVVERERTNNHGLLHKTLKRDSSACRQGMADYVLVFRKGGDVLVSDSPIPHAAGMEGYEGTSDPRANGFHPSPHARKPSEDEALAVWQRYAEPVWWDIDQMDTLNEKIARDSKDEKHICPLQLGLIRRCLHLWTNPGDVVLSPFAGIGSEGVVSVEMGRRFIGLELKEQYYKIACRNLAAAEEQASQPELFSRESLEVAG